MYAPEAAFIQAVLVSFAEFFNNRGGFADGLIVTLHQNQPAQFALHAFGSKSEVVGLDARFVPEIVCGLRGLARDFLCDFLLRDMRLGDAQFGRTPGSPARNNPAPACRFRPCIS